MMTTRRNVLGLLGLTGVGLVSIGAYSYLRGIRLPTLHWDPLAISTQFEVPEVAQCFGSDLIHTPTQSGFSSNFRAFAPQPGLNLVCDGPTKLVLSVSNISSQALFEYRADNVTISESRNKITRVITIETKSSVEISLQWILPKLDSYTFASIGDTGGDKELNWCIERAHALGAQFLLHLGDFNYQDTDYQRSIDAFNASEIPIYVTIGNHDFHDSGALYGRFMREIGPLNNVFSIGKTRFVNIDTAANILPFGAGQRGDMFKLMELDNNFTDTVAFTHRPLHDPSEGSHHDMGSDGERDWLIAALKRVNAKTLLSGHIHIYDRREFMGIDNIIAGQGLGHQDILINGDASKMVLGHVDSNGAVHYTAEPLAMPMEAHCHPRIDPVKESLRDGEHEAILKVLEKACGSYSI